jgi:3-dehydroquinate dehydratase-2
MKIIVIHGPNLNLLGKRDPNKYGQITMEEINAQLKRDANSYKIAIEFFQSNHEGAIIDFLQKDSSRAADGVLINPGALIRYAYCLRQALIDLNKPIIEIHMSEINKTGVNKGVNILNDVETRIKQITGLKENSYYLGLKDLITYLKERI